MFYLRVLVFSFLVLAFLSILSLLFLAIFPDLEILFWKFWSVNYICQVCKLYFYFENHLIFVHLFCPKNDPFRKNLYNPEMVGRRELPDPSLNRIFNALSIGAQYTLLMN